MVQMNAWSCTSVTGPNYTDWRGSQLTWRSYIGGLSYEFIMFMHIGHKFLATLWQIRNANPYEIIKKINLFEYDAI
jgi:hypothetical protein